MAIHDYNNPQHFQGGNMDNTNKYPFPNRIQGTSGEISANPRIAPALCGNIPVERKQRAIGIALNKLYESITNLDGKIGQLKKDIEPVCISKPKCDSQNKGIPEVGSDIDRAIYDCVGNIDRLSSIVDGMLDDLEI